jgi:ribonuclease E
VREFHPRETPILEAPSSLPASGAGYAPAEPVKIDWPSDLQQVESDPDKIRNVQEETVADQPAPRPRRVRPQAPRTSEEPLVQVETDRSETETSGAKTPA